MNVRLRHDMHFVAGIYYDGRIRMNNYTLTLWMTTACTDPVDQNTAFERIKYFVYNKIDSTVFVNSAHDQQCQLLWSAGLKITTMPGEPVDQLIGIMLYYKLNAIMEGRMIIEETEITSALGENMTYLHCENEHTDIPAQPDWWQAADPIHCDLALIDSDKVVTMPQASTWRELDLCWTVADTNTDTGNTVVFADFKKNDDTK
jgi:hypothetical protein